MTKKKRVKKSLTEAQASVMFLAADVIDYSVDQIGPVKKLARQFADELREKAFNL